MVESGKENYISRSLQTRTADFLALHPPFSFLPREALEPFAGKARIRYYGDGEYIFRQGDKAGDMMFILQKGKIEFFLEANEQETRLIDICDEGDTFGMRSFLTNNPYSLSARVVGEALIFVFSRNPVEKILSKYPRVAMYYAAGYASGHTIVRAETPQTAHSVSHIFSSTSLLSTPKAPGFFREEDVMTIKPIERVVHCTKDCSVKVAAKKMAADRVDSIVVISEDRLPQGIVTQSDMSRKVCTGLFEIGEPIHRIMSSPVFTLPKEVSVATVLLHMIRHHVRHIVITEDGTPDTAVVGIVSEHDVLVSQGNNPAVLAKKMVKAIDRRQLAEIRLRATEIIRVYLKQELSLEFITQTITALNDVLINKAIQLSQQQLHQEGLMPPDLTFCWLSLGSEGREEQILQTDQDNAILYQDPPEELADYAKEYFLKLGKSVTDILELSGFAHCPGEIMASNPTWNQPLKGWKAHFSQWIRTPEPKALMHSTIFFDFRAVYGDTSLADQLHQHLYEEKEKEPGFINFLAKNAISNPPPLSFFKQFVVERSGDQKDKLDIKLRGMMPLADAARVLILDHKALHITNTSQRFKHLSELEPQNKLLFEEAETAYDLMVRRRALTGFEHQNSGRYVNPKSLNKIEQKTLKTAFRTIEDLQGILRTRFMLDMFR